MSPDLFCNEQHLISQPWQDYVECLHHKKEFERMNTIMREAIKQEKAKLIAEGKSPGIFSWMY